MNLPDRDFRGIGTQHIRQGILLKYSMHQNNQENG